MKPFSTHSGLVAPLLIDNVDTDQIIPSREMKRVSKLGLGEGLFAGWRYRYDGTEKVGNNDDFVLNQAPFSEASILVSSQNFGCGSSREHAVWALADYGFRAVIAESFGRIFRNNCARNGLLAIELDARNIERIANAAGASPLSIDLEQQQIVLPDGSRIAFSVDAGDRDMLLKGLDYIDFALQFRDDTDRFVAADRQSRPWAYL